LPLLEAGSWIALKQSSDKPYDHPSLIMSEVPKPPGGDVDRGIGVIAMAWTECSLAIFIVALRIWARLIGKNIGWDDWMMVFTLVRQEVQTYPFCPFVWYFNALLIEPLSLYS
jgi:hypothetical protein